MLLDGNREHDNLVLFHTVHNKVHIIITIVIIVAALLLPAAAVRC